MGDDKAMEPPILSASQADDDSEDDVPLAALARKAPKKPAGTGSAKAVATADGVKHGDDAGPSDSNPQEPDVKTGTSDGRTKLQKKGNRAEAAAKPAAQTEKGKKAGVKKPAKGEDDETKGKPEKKARKEYEMPGQTRETPPETDGLRKFYSSLHEQRPDSVMAQRWLLMHGLLPKEEAEETLAKLKLVKVEARGGSLLSPARGRQPAKKPKVSPAPRKGAAEPKAKAIKKPEPKEKVGKKPAPAATKKRRAISESEEDESEDDDDDEAFKPAAKRRAPAKKPTGPPKPAANKKPPAKRSTKDTAFTDGGMDDSDSDEDVPLQQLAKAKGTAAR